MANQTLFERQLSDFIRNWPATRLSTMSISEYADLSNHNSLCYWLEYGTEELGRIGGIHHNKFELWQRKITTPFKDNRFKSDGTYAWNRNRGNTRIQAFNNVRDAIVEIARAANSGDWQAVENIQFHGIGKWKIAFLYSGQNLIPVYSKEMLYEISTRLGGSMNKKSLISNFQRFILNHKGMNEGIESFYERLIAPYRTRSYYIVGSKYFSEDVGGQISVFDQFLLNKCISVGFLEEHDFNSFIGADSDEVDSFVNSNWTIASPAIHKVRGYFSILSQIKKGDIIAIKSQGVANNLAIIAYAEVVSRNGSIYEHKPNLLGHHIHVEFIDYGFERVLPLTYAGTIHKLTAKKDKEAFFQIFGWYSDLSLAEESNGKDQISDENNSISGFNRKTELPYERGPSAGVTVNLVHNRIQNRFIDYLQEAYPDDKISGEKSRIDAKRENGNQLFIYEIKPYTSVHMCIRDGIGQLLDYQHKERTNKLKNIVIVGPAMPNEEDLYFIQSVRANINLPFHYLAFDDYRLTAVQF